MDSGVIRIILHRIDSDDFCLRRYKEMENRTLLVSSISEILLYQLLTGKFSNEKGCFCKRKELNCDEDGDCEGVRHNSEAISAYTPTLIRLGYNLNTKNDSFLNSTDDLFK